MSPQESRCQPAVSERTQVNDFALAVSLLEAIQLFFYCNPGDSQGQPGQDKGTTGQARTGTQCACYRQPKQTCSDQQRCVGTGNLHRVRPGDVAICQAPKEEVEWLAQTPFSLSRKELDHSLAQVRPADSIPFCVCSIPQNFCFSPCY